MTYEQKVAAYKAGAYRFKVPPVCHHLWAEADWINWITACNGWLKE